MSKRFDMELEFPGVRITDTVNGNVMLVPVVHLQEFKDMIQQMIHHALMQQAAYRHVGGSNR